MNQYINKILDLFKVTRKSATNIDDFHEWLINDEQIQEKEEALFHLWNEPNKISRNESVKALASLKSHIKPQKHIKQRKFNIGVFSAVAAVLALVFISSIYIITNQSVSEVNYIENYSQVGKVNTIILPDGSVVETNSSTILVYPEDFGRKSRTLYLSGEANFQVVKNEKIPFVVKSKTFAVTALGTEFNVSSYPNDDFYKTTLIEGSIKIENPEKKIEQLLSVEDQFVYNNENSTYTIEKVILDDVTAWQRGELVFQGATIKEIIKVLERKYGVVFHNNSKNTDAYNFRFQKDAPLSKVLNVMENVVGNFKYKLVEDICYIY